MIITQLSKLLLYFLTRLTSFFVTLFTMPIARLVITLMPDYFNTAASSIDSFITNYLVKGLSFAREVFFNCTGYPRVLLHLLVFMFMTKLSLRISLIAFRFLIKIYYVIRGSKVNS